MQQQMQIHKQEEYKVVSDSRTAKAIIAAGYNYLLDSIKAHKTYKYRTVFVFKLTDELQEFLDNHYQTIEKKYGTENGGEFPN